jgi:hypothetical protein
MNRSRSVVFAVIVALTVSSGCVRFSGPNALKRELSYEAGVELDREFAITITRSGVSLARMFTKEEDVPLKGVRRVSVGVYEVRGLREGVEVERSIDVAALLPEMTQIVRVHEDGENVHLLVKHDDRERIRQLVVVVTEADEWVIVRIKGNLNQTVESAMRMAFDEADRPERYESVMTAYREAEAERNGAVVATR